MVSQHCCAVAVLAASCLLLSLICFAAQNVCATTTTTTTTEVSTSDTNTSAAATNTTTTTQAPTEFQGPYVESPTRGFLISVFVSAAIGGVAALVWHFFIQSRYTFYNGASSGDALSFVATKSSAMRASIAEASTTSGPLPVNIGIMKGQVPNNIPRGTDMSNPRMCYEGVDSGDSLNNDE